MTTSAGGSSFESELVALIPHLRAFGRTLAGDAAKGDDLAQDALSKAWKHRAHFETGTNLKAWVFTILRNHFYGDKRRDWRSVQLDPEVAAQTLVSASNPTVRLEMDELRRALAMLPDEMREALILVSAGGLSYENAAEITGVAIGTVKSRVSRARDRLALIYAEGDIAPDGEQPSAAMDAIFHAADAIRARLTA